MTEAQSKPFNWERETFRLRECVLAALNYIDSNCTSLAKRALQIAIDPNPFLAEDAPSIPRSAAEANQTVRSAVTACADWVERRWGPTEAGNLCAYMHPYTHPPANRSSDAILPPIDPADEALVDRLVAERTAERQSRPYEPALYVMIKGIRHHFWRDEAEAAYHNLGVALREAMGRPDAKTDEQGPGSHEGDGSGEAAPPTSSLLTDQAQLAESVPFGVVFGDDDPCTVTAGLSAECIECGRYSRCRFSGDATNRSDNPQPYTHAKAATEFVRKHSVRMSLGDQRDVEAALVELLSHVWCNAIDYARKTMRPETASGARRCAACDQVRDDVGDLADGTLPMCKQCAKAHRMGYRCGEEAGSERSAVVSRGHLFATPPEFRCVTCGVRFVDASGVPCRERANRGGADE